MKSGEYQEFYQMCSGPYDAGRGYVQWLLEGDLVHVAMDVAMLEKPPQPFRAAYALEKVFLLAPERFTPHLGRFVRDFCRMRNPSVWRHYGKIMALLIHRESIVLTKKEKEKVSEAAFLYLLHPAAKVGMQVHMLDILHELRKDVPMVAEYLPVVVERFSIDPSPVWPAGSKG